MNLVARGQQTNRVDTIVVKTPLDAIHELEWRNGIAPVILVGACASDRQLGTFLSACYLVRVQREV